MKHLLGLQMQFVETGEEKSGIKAFRPVETRLDPALSFRKDIHSKSCSRSIKNREGQPFADLLFLFYRN